jgi:hypothetical protein
LSPAGAEVLSQFPLPLSIVQSLPAKGLVPEGVKLDGAKK